jgi:hypothetical protein
VAADDPLDDDDDLDYQPMEEDIVEQTEEEAFALVKEHAKWPLLE